MNDEVRKYIEEVQLKTRGLGFALQRLDDALERMKRQPPLPKERPWPPRKIAKRA